MSDDITLDDLRRRINEIDDEMLALVAERKQLSGEVARVKRSTGRATRDYEREREVILAARNKASQLGVAPDLAEEMMRLLIRNSLTTQEQLSVVAKGTGSGRRVLVIGGAGKMGRWFAEFLASQGFSVEVADPNGGPPGIPQVADWRQTDLRLRLHHLRHAAQRDGRDPARSRTSPPAGRRAGRGLAQEPAARRA